jgi:S1-C subfamily serine protease
MEGGRLYLERDTAQHPAGTIFAKDIVQTIPTKYRCELALFQPASGMFVGFVHGKIVAVTDSTIMFHYTSSPTQIGNDNTPITVLTKVRLDNEPWFLAQLKKGIPEPPRIVREPPPTEVPKESPPEKDVSQPPAAAQQVVLGTAWPVSSGYFVTNYHVVRNSKEIILVRPDGGKTFSKIAVRDVANDIALLRPFDLEQLPPALPLAKGPLSAGATVFTIGYPHPDLLGARSKLTDGTISSVFGLADDPRMYQISVPLHSGNSGGPLLNTKGEVVGVVVGKLGLKIFQVTGEFLQNVSYAVKIEYVKSLLDSVPKLEKHTIIPATKGSLEELAKRIKPSVVMVVATVLEKPEEAREKEQRLADLWDGTWIGNASSTSAAGQTPGSRRVVRCGYAALQMHIKYSNISGTAVDSNQISYQISGSVDSDGKVRVGIAKGGRNAANIEGSLSEGAGGGIWRDVYGCFGTWNVKKQ